MLSAAVVTGTLRINDKFIKLFYVSMKISQQAHDVYTTSN